MKVPRKMKLVKELADMCVAEGKEINSENINRKAMGFVYSGHHLAGKYEAITPGEVSRFFREYYEHFYPTTT